MTLAHVSRDTDTDTISFDTDTGTFDTDTVSFDTQSRHRHSLI